MLTVLRLGHRHVRDARITTHVCLTARALGADNVILSGKKDDKILDSVRDISTRFGGDFKIRYEKNWKKIIREFPGKKAHLTMYGMPIQKKIKSIKKHKDLLVIVGGEKVPWAVYEAADYNISVGNQPHSEVAALAVFLHDYFSGKELSREFAGADMNVIPQELGKKTNSRISEIR